MSPSSFLNGEIPEDSCLLNRLYDSISADENVFSHLSSTHTNTLETSNSTLGSPMVASSPKMTSRQPSHKRKVKSLRIVVMNFQSLKNKAADTQVFIDNAEPDVIIGCETWLNKDIFTSEVLPSNYWVYRSSSLMIFIK